MNVLCLVAALTLSAGDEPTLLVFTAPNCPACETSEPTISRLIDAGVPLERIDYVAQPRVCQQYKVTHFPTFVLIAEGREIDRLSGPAGYDRVAKLLQKMPTRSSNDLSRGESPTTREVVRGQSPDTPSQGFLGKTFGRLWGASGKPKGENAPERRDPFAVRARTRANESDDDVEISRATEPDRRRTQATPVSQRNRSTSESETPPPSPRWAKTRTIEPEMTSASTDANESPADEMDVAIASAQHAESPAQQPESPSNSLRGMGSLRTASRTQPSRPWASSQADFGAGNLSPQQRAIASTVRVKVTDSRGASDGSGVIIHRQHDEALVATCGHIFRESQGRGRITVDLFIPGAAPVEGELIEYNVDRDIALLSIRPAAEVVTASVAPSGYQFQDGDAVFSVGCVRGRNPELIESTITGINRYKNVPPHIVVDGAPAQGRSGGGLFSEEGYLIGICNAADKAGREGIYAGLPTLHAILDETDLADVYRQAPGFDRDQNVALAHHQDEIAPEHSEPEMEHTMPSQPRGVAERNTLRNQNRSPEVERENPIRIRDSESPSTPAGPRKARLGEPVAEADEEEADIICIVRSRTNPTAQNDVLVIRQATPELLSQINRAAAPPPDASRPSGSEDPRPLAPPADNAGRMANRPDQAIRTPRPNGFSPPATRPRGPIVRGQSIR